MYSSWKVGDRIQICTKIEDFCGAITEFLFLRSSDMQKYPDPCSLTCLRPDCAWLCLDPRDREVRFFSCMNYISATNDVNCINKKAEKWYRELGSVRSDFKGSATLLYTVTEQDRLDYLDALANGKTYDIVCCMTDPLATSAHAIVFKGITVEPAPKYKCTGAPNYQCVEDPNGPYSSLEACQSACLAPPPEATHYISLSMGFIPAELMDYFDNYISEISAGLMTKIAPPPSPWEYLRTTYDRATNSLKIWLYLPTTMSPGPLEDLANWIGSWAPLVVGALIIIISGVLLLLFPVVGWLAVLAFLAIAAGVVILEYIIYDLRENLEKLRNKVTNLEVQLNNIENKAKADQAVEETWQKSAKARDDCITRLEAHRDQRVKFIDSYMDKYAKYADLVTELKAERDAFLRDANSIIEEFKGKTYSVEVCDSYYGQLESKSNACQVSIQVIIKKYVKDEEKYIIACKGYTNQAGCEKAECYWYDNACHAEEQCWIANPLGGCILSAKTGKTILFTIGMLGGVGVTYWLLTRKPAEVKAIVVGAREAALAEAERARAAYRELKAPQKPPPVPTIPGAPVPG